MDENINTNAVRPSCILIQEVVKKSQELDCSLQDSLEFTALYLYSLETLICMEPGFMELKKEEKEEEIINIRKSILNKLELYLIDFDKKYKDNLKND